MHDVVIGIPTYKRPLMLKKLILSISDCNIDKSLIGNLNIIIVDNDIDRSAEEIVEGLKNKFSGIQELNYYNYPVKGLSNVRNELFNKALEFTPDYIACIDDDEYATSDWLNELFLAVKKTNAEIVLGPVIPVFENKVRSSISYWFRYLKLENHKRVEFFWTGNFIISANFLSGNKIKFDERFNFTGSEDSYFGLQLMKKGAKIYWAANAIVYETIPDKRANLNWLIRRNYNSALTYTYILKLEKKYFRLLKKTIISVTYFLVGSMALLAVLFPFRWKYWGILKISESIGGFAGLFSVLFHEYANDR